MSKGLKIFLWVLVVLAVLAIIAFVWGKSAWDKISFSAPKVQAFDLKSITLQDLANIAITGQTKEVNLTLGMDIKNENNFSVPFSNLNVSLFYNGQFIAQTADKISAVIPANGILSISSIINIMLNISGVKMLIQKISGNNPIVNCVITAKVFGIRIPIQKINLTL